jgi:hypothetical protein
MPYRLESDWSDKTMRCAVCEGKFGFVRHYSVVSDLHSVAAPVLGPSRRHLRS